MIWAIQCKCIQYCSCIVENLPCISRVSIELDKPEDGGDSSFSLIVYALNENHGSMDLRGRGVLPPHFFKIINSSF